MHHRNLAGRSVAALGLGDISFARAAARGHDANDVVRRVHDALELAIDVLELAPEPDVEHAVGDAVRGLRARDRAVVAMFDSRASFPARRSARADPSALRARRVSRRASRATRLDALPLVQLPLRTSWRASSAWAELQGTCERLIREGQGPRVGALIAEPDAHATEDGEGTTPAQASSFADALRDDPASSLFALAPTSAAEPAPKLLHPLAEPWLAALAVEFSLCARGSAPVLAAAPTHAIFARRPLAGGALAR